MDAVCTEHHCASLLEEKHIGPHDSIATQGSHPMASDGQAAQAAHGLTSLNWLWDVLFVPTPK